MVMAAGKYRYATVKVSHGGNVLRSSHGDESVYVGGETKLVEVPRSITLREFHDRLAAIAGCFKVAVRYVRPHETLDQLRDLMTDDDLQEVLDWVLLRDLKNNLPGAKPANEIVPDVRVFVARVDVRPPLPESLFSSAPTTNTHTPPVSPSCLTERSASAPSLSANPAYDKSIPPSPYVIQRSATASTLTPASTQDDATTTSITTAAAESGIAHETQGYVVVHDAAPAPYPVLHWGPVGTDPVFLVPVIVYQPVIPVYQGFLVPAGDSQVRR